MKKLFLLLILVSSHAFATKGLIDNSVLSPPSGQDNAEVPSPKVSKGFVDLNLTDRTNQAMSLQSLNATQEIFDSSDPFANTLKTNYSENKTIKVRVREFMGTMILLPKGDTIKMFKLGDVDNFSFEPSTNPYDDELPNSGTASVVLAGADTSLHILGTSGNVYTFYLRGDTWDSPHNPTMKVLVTDDKLLAKLEAQKRREAIEQEREQKRKSLESNDAKLENPDYLEKVAFDPTKIDFGYRIVGGKESIKPYMVYSDGHFTYFRFAEGDSVADVVSFPAVYRVADKSDVPVNVSANGSTLRAEGIANNWTLRLGKEWLCIEKIVKTPNPESSMNVIVNEGSK
ncbi:TrbG/VirB9 family P-type conjugative transfer protein [Vibrio ordalii]|uniref:TrbG/VirB9 family P-type conjugative transfer protein n=1 Tax=Vibrio ordalii TaxID=28174 RepID=UPI00024835C9|nr:TrbG/VirB9 family P-type conjugative transfer protein [Vibrio ordalii]